MSKPDKPGELRGVTVDAISLVPKAANGEKFKVFKNAKAEETKAPEAVKKDGRGLLHVSKGEVADKFNAQDNGRKLHNAIDALLDVLGIGWREDAKPETDPEKIREALLDFTGIAEQIFSLNDADVVASAKEVEKAGRKISGSRLSKLKDIQAMLSEVLSGLDDTSDEQEVYDLTKDEVQKAVSEAIAPLIDRIERVEKARGISNRVQEDAAVQKSSNDFWGGIF